MANEKQLNFNIGASLAPSFKQAFGKAGEALGVLEKTSNRFKLQQKQVSEEMAKLYKNIDASPEKLKKLENAMKKNREEAQKSKERLIQLRAEMKNGDPEKKLGEEYKNLRSKLTALNKDYKSSENQKEKINTKTEEERKKVTQLITDYNKLGDAIKKTDKVKRQFAISEKVTNVGKGMKKIGNKATVIGGIGAGMIAPIVQQAIKAESAFADVKKQFDFATKEEEENFKAELHKLITEKKMAITLPEAYGASANAGQSGLSKEDSIPYVEQSIKMAIAFDMPKEEAAAAMFKIKNALKLELPDLKILIDQINYLGNTTGANAASITDYLLRIGNIAKTANLSAASTSALGATLIEQGIDSDKAATGVKNLILTMTAGAAATKSQSEGFEKLGLDPEKVAKDMQKNAEATIKKIFERINKLKKHEKTSIMQTLFGKESLTSAAGTMANLDKLLENLQKVRDKSLYEGSAEKEYQSRAQTTENNIQTTIGQTQILASEIGTNLLPILNDFLTQINKITSEISKFAKENPEQFKEIVEIIGYGVPLLIAFGTAMNIAGSVVTLVGALGKLIPVIASLNLAMLANPATWVAAGIATLVAGTYALIANWDKISAWMDEKKEGIKNWFGLGENKPLKENAAAYGVRAASLGSENGMPYGATRKFANGGIVTSPTMGLVGEAGYPEAIIPLNGSQRAHSLWETTGRILGNSDYKNSNSSNSSLTYNPSFHISITASNPSEVKGLLNGYEEESYNNFKRKMDDYNRENKRRRG